MTGGGTGGRVVGYGGPVAGYYPTGETSRDNPIVIVTSNWSWLASRFEIPAPLYAVSDVQIHHRLRGKGYARRAMKELLDDADLNHVHLILVATPDPGYEWVYDWYGRLGFEPLEDHKTMLRRPDPMHLISHLGTQTRS